MGYCPSQCLTHEILCPSQLDPCNGCPTEEVCREAIKDKNGIFCPGKEIEGLDSQDTSLRKGGYLSFSHNCPKLCREEEGEVLCPAYEDENGCKPEAECMMRTTDDNGDWCPSHSVCQKQCQKDSYSANTKPSIPRDARLSQAAFTKERIIMIYTAPDIVHQSALEEKHLYLLDMMLTVVNFHLFAKYPPKEHMNSYIKI